jgi:hypothetical protein
MTEEKGDGTKVKIKEGKEGRKMKGGPGER